PGRTAAGGRAERARPPRDDVPGRPNRFRYGGRRLPRRPQGGRAERRGPVRRDPPAGSAVLVVTGDITGRRSRLAAGSAPERRTARRRGEHGPWGEYAAMTHPRKSLDEVIHAPVRFSIMAALAAVESADFKTVREAVEVTDSTLSKQVSTLEGAGYVQVRKT